MSILGFTFTTTGIYLCSISGTKLEPVLNRKLKLNLPQNLQVEQLVEWFETELSLILNKDKPSYVTYRLTFSNISHNYIANVFYGQAILNLLCSKRSIGISHTSPASIVASKFNLPKDADLRKYIDLILGSPANPWDAKMRDNALMTLIYLS